MTTLVLDIPRAWWMSSNDRMHWTQKGERTRWVRAYTAAAARAANLPRYEMAMVWAFIQYPRAGRVDPMNAAPTLKAAIDGLVDAGVFPDDDHQHVLGPAPLREPGKAPKDTYRIRLVLTDQEVPF